MEVNINVVLRLFTLFSRKKALQQSLLEPTEVFHSFIENKYVLDPYDNKTRKTRNELAEMVKYSRNGSSITQV